MKALESASSRLKQRLEELSFDFKKSLGQNFLISDHVISKIIAEAERLPFQKLIEIGPGLGSLTDLLKELSPDLQLIELDHRLSQFWIEKGFNVTQADALKWDWNSLPQDQDILLVSNLPYQISSSLVIDRCEGPRSLKWMVLMFQKEVAQRLTAEASTSNYGLLSVMAQLHFSIRKVVEAAPRDFKPSPKVASRVLYFERLKPLEVETSYILSLLKQGFSQRRKKLVNNLKSLLARSKYEPKDLEAWLVSQNLSAQARAEELSPKLWLELAIWLTKN